MEKSYLLDTDIVIYWLKNKYPKIREKIDVIPEDSIFISSITVAELYFGAYNSAQKETNLSLIKNFFKEINIIDFDEGAGKCFGEIKTSLKRKGRIISDSDIFIAAVAISNSCVLVTNNEKHFERIEALDIENWV